MVHGSVEASTRAGHLERCNVGSDVIRPASAAPKPRSTEEAGLAAKDSPSPGGQRPVPGSRQWLRRPERGSLGSVAPLVVRHRPGVRVDHLIMVGSPTARGASGLLTVGHGTLGSEAFVELVDRAGVRQVVDVRRMPSSRRHPQFGLDRLSSSLPGAGVRYRWEPRLGGVRRSHPDAPNIALRHRSFRAYADWMSSPEFAAALDELLSGHDGLSAVMCAESLWWRCHRRLIADAAVLLGAVEVSHLGHDGRLQGHRVTEGARVHGDVVVYDMVVR